MEQLVNPKWSKERRRELRARETNAERFLWSHLRNRRCGGIKFRRQVGIGSYIADFYAYERKLVVELDGTSHYTEEARLHDIERSQYLRDSGIRILRFKNFEVANYIDSVIERIIAFV